MQLATAFEALRKVPPDRMHIAAADLLERRDWIDVVEAALQMPDDVFVESVLPEYVPDVEPKVFLIHQIEGTFQVVLHHFDRATFDELLARKQLGPHFHHFSFATRILHGQYAQWLFRNEGTVREPRLGFGRQVLCPKDTVYSLGHEQYHCVLLPEDDTMSLMIRGPAQFIPRAACERTPDVVRAILGRRERMRAVLPRLAGGVARRIEVDAAAQVP